MRPGPKPHLRSTLDPEVEAALREEFGAAQAMAREAREAMARDGAAVKGSRGNVVLSPHARVWQSAVAVMARLGPKLSIEIADDEPDSIADAIARGKQ